MKKTILILSIITVFGFTGCSKADIEKKPIAIADDTSLEDKELEDSKDNITNEEITNESEAMDAGEETKEEEADSSGMEVKPTPETIEIEGGEETINGLWYEGDDYKIMYDADRFEYSNKDGADTFIAQNPDPAIYPYVYLSITQLDNKSTSDYAKELSDTLTKNNFKSEITTDVSIGNYKGTKITANDGLEWNSSIRNYYMIENNTSIYVIESQYFLEAEEGYGGRMDAMLQTFTMN